VGTRCEAFAEALYGGGRTAGALLPPARYPLGYLGAPFVAPPAPLPECVKDPSGEVRALSLLPESWRAGGAVGLRALLDDGGGDCVLLAPPACGGAGGEAPAAAGGALQPLQPVLLPPGSLDRAKLPLRVVRFIAAAQRTPWEGWCGPPGPGEVPRILNPYGLVPCPPAIVMAGVSLASPTPTVKTATLMAALLADASGASLGSAPAQATDPGFRAHLAAYSDTTFASLARQAVRPPPILVPRVARAHCPLTPTHNTHHHHHHHHHPLPPPTHTRPRASRTRTFWCRRRGCPRLAKANPRTAAAAWAST
jgi:hypothetical protein